MPSVRSSAITFVDYDPETKELRITFTRGFTYTYYGVPASVYAGLLNASSVGTYFNDHIRDRYAN